MRVVLEDLLNGVYVSRMRREAVALTIVPSYFGLVGRMKCDKFPRAISNPRFTAPNHQVCRTSSETEAKS
jgi:hypothetical protein